MAVKTTCIKVQMVQINGGAFMMGKQPQYEVTVDSFRLGKYSITARQWLAIMGDISPPYYKAKSYPVDSVAFEYAMIFCDKLSEVTGKKYRLPTEAEWEYACRAGTIGEHYFGDNKLIEGQCNIGGKKPTPVGKFPPNQFGLYDMYGNVWEWCADNLHDKNHDKNLGVIRGGSWKSNGDNITSSLRREYIKCGVIHDGVGLRVALDL